MPVPATGSFGLAERQCALRIVRRSVGEGRAEERPMPEAVTKITYFI